MMDEIAFSLWAVAAVMFILFIGLLLWLVLCLALIRIGIRFIQNL